MKDITFIKLGGAVITNKDIPESIREGVLDRLVEEIARAQKETGKIYILGNGSGSFAHVPAARYKTMEGFIHDESRMGMAITQDSAARCNREVVKVCLRHGLPAVTLAPSNSLVTKKKTVAHFFSEVLREYLKKDLLPVAYGDVLVDQEQGCTIWSTDKVFGFLARQLKKDGWRIDQIVHVTEAEGVWKDESKQIYPVITPHMKDEVKKSMVDTRGFDVTGGMWHKIEEALALTDLGMTTRILSGLKENTLYEVLLGNASIGTTITI